jgi:hypothetical protein
MNPAVESLLIKMDESVMVGATGLSYARMKKILDGNQAFQMHKGESDAQSVGYRIVSE